jgi:biopolymer transport protein ExbD
MAFTLNGSSHGAGKSRFRGLSPLSEINVVPLVDVVLVLLIIFMLTAHVMEFGLEIDVPKVNKVKDTTQELPVVSLNKDGDLYLNGKTVNINAVGDEVKRRFIGATAVYLQADKGTTWEAIASVIAALGDAKLHVNVVTQPEEETGKRR